MFVITHDNIITYIFVGTVRIFPKATFLDAIAIISWGKCTLKIYFEFNARVLLEAVLD